GTLQIYDVEQKKVVRTLSGAPEPDQVGFTGSFAYVRAAGTASVALIPLANPLSGAIGPHDYFPAGSTAPGSIARDSLGEVMAPQPGVHDALYVANPAERMVYSYHYMEGMPVPHGGLTTYAFTPKSIRVVSRRVRETEPGVYTATVRMERSGDYDLIFRNTEPYLLGCYGFEVAADPALHTGQDIRVEVAQAANTLKVGANTVRFRVTDTRAGGVVNGLEDFRVQLASTDGWQTRAPAKAVGEGVYEVEVNLPAEGIYFAAFEIPSRGVRLRDGGSASFRAAP
ncbi:MAG TPA: FixH family protein, partial [Longimicrobium sp.]|nr:FixH family protein [Longimicrobium sp.]